MLSLQLLSLIALWCGNPTSITYVRDGMIATSVTVKQVNQCRNKIIKCIEDSRTSFAFDGSQPENLCFQTTPYPGKDN